MNETLGTKIESPQEGNPFFSLLTAFIVALIVEGGVLGGAAYLILNEKPLEGLLVATIGTLAVQAGHARVHNGIRDRHDY